MATVASSVTKATLRDATAMFTVEVRTHFDFNNVHVSCTAALTQRRTFHTDFWLREQTLEKDDAICKNCFFKVKRTGNTADMPNPLATPPPAHAANANVSSQPGAVKAMFKAKNPRLSCKVRYLQRKVCHASKVKAPQRVEVYIKTSLFGFSKERT